MPGAVPLLGKAEDATVFAHAIWHGPSPNRSGKVRKTILYQSAISDRSQPGPLCPHLRTCQCAAPSAAITTNQAAIAALFRVVNRYIGNLAPMPGVFPDYPAPVVRNADNEREFVHHALRHASDDVRAGQCERRSLNRRKSEESAVLARRETGCAMIVDHHRPTTRRSD
jgi:ectoine hydroxylase-related dioxygenase (phytanoyl-CoA dioxygenase family)